MSTAGPFGLQVGDAALEGRLTSGLDAVEQLLHDTVKSEDAFVSEVARHLVEAGGKRFRPMLVLLAAEFGDREAPGVVPAAVVVELTHLATLYHDDVMDEARCAAARPRRTRAGTTPSRSSPATSSSPGRRTCWPTSVRQAVRIQARTFERLVTGPDPRDGRGPKPARTRSTTTSRCWPTRPAR
jgi:heptaprenyl diphosphate synthase